MGPTVELSGGLTPGTGVPGGLSSQQNGKALGEQEEGQEREGKAQQGDGYGQSLLSPAMPSTLIPTPMALATCWIKPSS